MEALDRVYVVTETMNGRGPQIIAVCSSEYQARATATDYVRTHLSPASQRTAQHSIIDGEGDLWEYSFKEYIVD